VETWRCCTRPSTPSGSAGRRCSGKPNGSFEPFFSGRWGAAAQAHAASGDGQFNPEAAARYGSEGAFDPPATRAALTELEAAVLVMAGELDGVPTPERAGEPAALFPEGEVVVRPGGGHFPWLDDPDWCVRTVIGFLSR
jgi:pimeloyl-ACP methyl ester carboxylesterase